MQPITLFWHRRDLRVEDNAGLYRALTTEQNVQPIFIFDKNILDELPAKDRRVDFIYECIEQLNAEYLKWGTRLWTFYGTPEGVFEKLTQKFSIKAVYTNRDYEPYAQKRDKAILDILAAQNIAFRGFKDHVFFDKNEVVKDNGEPYTVFTPYSKKWKAKLNPFFRKPYPTLKYLQNLNQTDSENWVTYEKLGFEKTGFKAPPNSIDREILGAYKARRDFPAKKGTSRLSIHLRFGTISIRKCVSEAINQHSEAWLNELIWRDFYQMILYHFPENVNHAFKAKYDQIQWENHETHFKAWCDGKTGYPIVDAGMRELNETGYMHNRVRMITASFLTKHLLIDWRWGEAYFAEKLNDFDLAANNGGWQWAASCGTDAAPYFRIFNPYTQAERFDPQRKYIKKWVPEVDNEEYPEPIVEHKWARERALERYKKALG